MEKKHIFIIIASIFIVAGSGYFFLNQPLSCQNQHDDIESEIDKANYCQIDSDCDILILGGSYIEFGCYHFINKEVDKELFYGKMQKYASKCSRMINECAPAPEARCVSNKCAYVKEMNNSAKEGPEPEYYISCGCGCCVFDKRLEEIAKVECLYHSKGEKIQDKIDQDNRLTPESCAAVGCSFPIKYVYCD